jgi:hypothetical protein
MLMTTTRWFSLCAMTVLLVAYAQGCDSGSSGTGSAGTGGPTAGTGAPPSTGTSGTGAPSTTGTAGTGSSNTGTAGTGAGPTTGGGGTNGGTAGTRGGNNNRDGGAPDRMFTGTGGTNGGNNNNDGGNRRDTRVNRDALTGVDLNISMCATGVMNGGDCESGTDTGCTLANGRTCACVNDTWRCFNFGGGNN